MEFNMKKVLILLLTSFAVCLSACKQDTKKQDKKQLKTVVAQEQPVVSTLYFKGNVQPATLINVTSPVEGTVGKLLFTYGQHVNKGAPLIVIESDSMEKQYQAALSKYIKAKETYETNKTKWAGTQELQKHGLVSKIDYITARNALDDSELGVVQSKRELNIILEIANINLNLDKLTRKQALKFAEKVIKDIKQIKLHSPGAGIVLFPEKSSSSDKDTAKELTIGSPVKKGTILVAIGDLTGIAVKVKVGETNIEAIKVSQLVSITTPALPDLKLQASVVRVGTQALTEGASLPTFNVRILVPKLTTLERQRIHVGMSVKVKMKIDQGRHVVLPINAVEIHDNKAMVRVVDDKTGKITLVRVKTGPTTLTHIAILEGITPGTKVVVEE